MVSPLVEFFIDRATGLPEQVPMTRRHTMHADLVRYLVRFRSVGMVHDVWTGDISRHMKSFKMAYKTMSYEN